METVYIVSVARTPMGSFGGELSSLSAIQLGSHAIKGAIQRAGIDPQLIEEVYMGNVCSANLGQAPAKQAALGAGLSNTVPCTTINKVCASGMKAIMFGAQSIMLGLTDIAVAGGMESMSNIPYYIPKARWGHKFGHGELLDGLTKDGLTDAYDHIAMGVSGDQTATKYGITREDQDRFAIQSYKRSAQATADGKFENEIIPISIPQRKGDDLIISEDEEYKKVKFDKIPSLRPAFSKDGTVTAANASTLNDGGSAVLLASEKIVKELGLKPIAKILSFADAAHAPLEFTTAPTKAAPKALDLAQLKKEDIDFFEVNEAFAVVPIAFNQELDIDEGLVNVNGGGVALGHPLGSSGSRIVCTLANVLVQNDAQFGLATLCNGGGGASAMIIERV